MNSSSKLHYHGTDIEVRLGDRVLIARLFRRPIPGVVSYIPGVSPKHPELEREVPEWAVQLEDGTLVSWVYVPAELQPSRRVQFVGRGSTDFEGIGPDTELT